MKKDKVIEETKLYIKEVVDEFIDVEGNMRRRVAWKLVNGDVNLGSLKKPRSDLVGFKYEIPKEHGSLPPAFRRFFG